MQFYNTLSRSKEAFVPLVAGTVGMYCCGPTVYNYVHIGNLRAYIFDDALRRTLRFNGFSLRHVMNITDVGHLESDADEGEDKMEKGASREGLSVWEIARKYERAFFEDASKLNIQTPEVVCRATEHVDDMIALIQKLVDKGCAYVTPGALYFDTSVFPTYTALARLDLGGLLAGAGGRVELLGEKRHPNDFALWFLNKPRHIMQWDSPWGRGYPGWHIECSAMSMKYLGESFDIHCGGVDHIPVHHTNEIAQSECASGRPFVRYWLHNEFLIIAKSRDEADSEGFEKMAKSGENFLTLNRLIEHGYDPLALRYLCLQAHYRSELRFSWETLDGAQNGLRRLYGARPANDPLADDGRFAAARAEALELLNDDLNTPQLLAALHRHNSYRLWTEFDDVLGLDIARRSRPVEEPVPPDVEAVVDERNDARGRRDFARSDALRDRLIGMGWDVADTPQGTTVKRRLL
jgi:cysteinyl-tRNA synthetase